ncbi:MAG: hypothetical protein EI684_22335 [Candidatus Viridilinea halotolerans]|uniref:Uncharacterized protein n=1 Tax=Candidatus Viridilinea halotolerans TaxID=2491704 RepID=A0A426TQT4_9CHLR|nr:MAG: hypothetical protein EI684_22335 [Candidatus Viridilinea halotolerans]
MKRRKGSAAPVTRVPAPAPESRANHGYPPGWRRNNWFVPFIGGGACIHHGHATDADDHSRCGPAIFCCPHAATRYITLFPTSCEARALWEPTSARHLATWLDNGVNVFYFVFCDPERADGLLAIGLGGQLLRDVLWYRVPIETQAPYADRLTHEENSDDTFR